MYLGMMTLENDGISVNGLPDGESCYWDWTFDKSDNINDITLQNLDIRDALIIFNSFCLDVMIACLLYLYQANVFPCTSLFLCLGFNSLTKMFI